MKDSFFTRGPAKLRTMADVNAKLAQRTGKPVYGTGSSGPAGDASASGRLGDSKVGQPPTRTLPEPTQDPAFPDAPTGRHAEVLEWMEPVVHGDGSGFQLSTNATWSVVKERQMGGGWIYRLFRRWPLAELVYSAKSAEIVRACAQGYADAQGRT